MSSKPRFVGEKVPFADAFTEVSRGTKKFKQSEYAEIGAHPIVDQGKEAIAGYSDEENGLFTDVPAIVFGDHTRCVKYVEEPFFAGADGVKILKPKLPGSTRFWWHALRATPIEDLGYSRHFKLLKAATFKVVNEARQEEVVACLDGVLEQISYAEDQLTGFDSLVKSRFVEMFGDTYLNSMAWDSCKLGELISFMTSGSRGWARYYSDDGEYFLTIKNVKKCKVDVSGVQHVIAPVGKESVRTKVQENDVLISITADLGRTGVVTKEIADHGAYINQHLACIRLTDDSVDPVFLSHFLESPGGIDQFAKKNQNGVKAGLNFNLIRSLEIQMPPLALQQEFAAFASQVDKSRFIAQQQIEKLQMLYDSLAQDYFGD